ncbi:hypothetical protein DFS34DRAFT_588919 [Phlyctochytrium arcticum]|nr:hypothetical protein DFS34DRAFT_588919 [Phlyctochytrium arcticum]
MCYFMPSSKVSIKVSGPVAVANGPTTPKVKPPAAATAAAPPRNRRLSLDSSILAFMKRRKDIPPPPPNSSLDRPELSPSSTSNTTKNNSTTTFLGISTPHDDPSERCPNSSIDCDSCMVTSTFEATVPASSNSPSWTSTDTTSKSPLEIAVLQAYGILPSHYTPEKGQERMSTVALARNGSSSGPVLSALIAQDDEEEKARPRSWPSVDWEAMSAYNAAYGEQQRAAGTAPKSSVSSSGATTASDVSPRSSSPGSSQMHMGQRAVPPAMNRVRRRSRRMSMESAFKVVVEEEEPTIVEHATRS